MHSEIQDTLEHLVDERGIRILYACESGSRAWGLASPDSDWDVRFIYAWPQDRYLEILDVKDSINLRVTKGTDLTGWDLRKALQLFGKSNAAPYEWLQSPIVYKEAPGFHDALWEMAPRFFAPVAALKHYIGVTRSSLKRTPQKDGSWKLTSLFGVLRPAYAASWVAERGTIPPMEFDLLREMEPPDLAPLVDDLLAQKSEAGEAATLAPLPELATYAEAVIARCTEAGTGMIFDPPDLDALNGLFRQWID